METMIRYHRIAAVFIIVALFILASLSTLSILSDGGDFTNLPAKGAADGGDFTNLPARVVADGGDLINRLAKVVADGGEFIKLPSSIDVSQYDYALLHFMLRCEYAPEGSARKLRAQQDLNAIIAHRKHVDYSIERIGKLLFGAEKGSEVLNTFLPGREPSRDCAKLMFHEFETWCGYLCEYGMKYWRSLSNICNAGVSVEKMAEASSQACPGPNPPAFPSCKS